MVTRSRSIKREGLAGLEAVLADQGTLRRQRPAQDHGQAGGPRNGNGLQNPVVGVEPQLLGPPPALHDRSPVGVEHGLGVRRRPRGVDDQGVVGGMDVWRRRRRAPCRCCSCGAGATTSSQVSTLRWAGRRARGTRCDEGRGTGRGDLPGLGLVAGQLGMVLHEPVDETGGGAGRPGSPARRASLCAEHVVALVGRGQRAHRHHDRPDQRGAVAATTNSGRLPSSSATSFPLVTPRASNPRPNAGPRRTTPRRSAADRRARAPHARRSAPPARRRSDRGSGRRPRRADPSIVDSLNQVQKFLILANPQTRQPNYQPVSAGDLTHGRFVAGLAAQLRRA